MISLSDSIIEATLFLIHSIVSVSPLSSSSSSSHWIESKYLSVIPTIIYYLIFNFISPRLLSPYVTIYVSKMEVITASAGSVLRHTCDLFDDFHNVALASASASSPSSSSASLPSSSSILTLTTTTSGNQFQRTVDTTMYTYMNKRNVHLFG